MTFLLILFILWSIKPVLDTEFIKNSWLKNNLKRFLVEVFSGLVIFFFYIHYTMMFKNLILNSINLNDILYVKWCEINLPVSLDGGVWSSKKKCDYVGYLSRYLEIIFVCAITWSIQCGFKYWLSLLKLETSDIFGLISSFMPDIWKLVVSNFVLIMYFFITKRIQCYTEVHCIVF